MEPSISEQIWSTKYRLQGDGTKEERCIQDTWRRVARALAGIEASRRSEWEERFYGILDGFGFLPGGRILAGAGSHRNVTLFNCFVMAVVHDSLNGIFDALKEGALTMQQGGGVGYDFSALRPRGVPATGVGSIASGPVSFMGIWDSMCQTLLSTGARRGAMMATLRCDHPDIEAFIDAKRTPGALRSFNLSVLVDDAFMRAVSDNAEWPLLFPVVSLPPQTGGRILMRRWSGAAAALPCRVVRVVRARALWERLMRATYDYAEPGVLFVDRINALNNLWYREQISATNPCGEVPLPPYGACDLGSINLTRMVRDPFSTQARLDFRELERVVGIAVRMLDNVIDASRYPLDAQLRQAHGTRRIGLGITGLADALIMLGQAYGSREARRTAAGVMRSVCHTAYRTSVATAREKGPFPWFQAEYLQGSFVGGLPSDIRQGITEHGLRNSHLLSIAPAGTISLLAGSISSGIEPVFDFEHRRRVLGPDGAVSEQPIVDYALEVWRKLHGTRPHPKSFIRATDLSPVDHLKMQAALQPFVDNAISKTINIPAEYPFEAFQGIYTQAYELGLKGCTTFRPNPVTGAVLYSDWQRPTAASCCDIDRESD